MLEYVKSRLLSKTAHYGAAWAQVDLVFPAKEIFASITLSAHRHQVPERFKPYQQAAASAYIVTPQTPMGYGGGVSWPTRWDGKVHLTTDRLSFLLAVDNGGGYDDGTPPAYAQAVGAVYEVAHQPIDPYLEWPPPAWKVTDVKGLLVVDERGHVVVASESHLVDGGEAGDEGELRERLLAQAHDVTGREPGSLQVTAFDPQELPEGAELHVDPSTGRVEVVEHRPGLQPFGRRR
ncbi:MAG TPA: hypothetical protein VE781_06295 [Kineosporiaceae bacterium]|nr:hypothetical protein [Kineosporiaceae bacterium]